MPLFCNEISAVFIITDAMVLAACDCGTPWTFLLLFFRFSSDSYYCAIQPIICKISILSLVQE